MTRLKEKVAIVTGGASGIGLATVKAFLAQGASVAFTDVDKKKGEKVLETLKKKAQKRARFFKHDVTKEAHWERVVNQTVEAFGHIDILVNNAGIYKIIALPETTLDEFQSVMDVNVLGVFLGMKHVCPKMAEQGGGSVINLSSVAGLIGAPSHVAYGASKGAVRVMTKDVALEYGSKGVRVNSVHPGYIDTQMAKKGAEAAGTDVKGLGKDYPLGHIGQPEDVAHAVVFLASDESAFITGTELVIDGGVTAR